MKETSKFNDEKLVFGRILFSMDGNFAGRMMGIV
jgi:hypothetical protein